MHDLAFIFAYWNNYGTPVFRDMRNPISYAAQTLKFYNPNCKIYVMDYSEHPVDWSNVSQMEIIPFKIAPSLNLRLQFKAYGKRKFDEYSISQIFDLPKFNDMVPENNLFFVDTDQFWIQEADLTKGIDQELFNCHPINCGCWFYNKQSPSVKEFIAKWINLLKKTMSDDVYCEDVLEYFQTIYSRGVKFEIMTQERAYAYLLRSDAALLSSCRFEDYYNVILPRRLKTDISLMRSLHVMHGWFRDPIIDRFRGRLCWIVKELRCCLSDEIPISVDDCITINELFSYDKQRISEILLKLSLHKNLF